MKNKNKNEGGFLFFLLISLLLAGFFGFSKNAQAQDSLMISAVQIKGIDSDDDFIEFYNPTCADISLTGWKVKKKTKTNSAPTPIGTLKNAIPAKGYYLWENTSKNLSDNPDYTTKTYYLSDDYSIALFDNAEKQIDSITWGANPHPFALTVLYAYNPTAFQSIIRAENDTVIVKNNYTPKNSFAVEKDELDKCPKENPKIYSDKIVINELLPAPSSGGEEYIEFYNPAAEVIDISGYILKDASRTGEYVFPEATEIKSLDYLVIYKKDFKFALNNSGAESVTLFDPDEKTVSTISYSGSKESVSYNFNGGPWRWSKFLTPGKVNKFNSLPEVSKKKDKKIYANIYADFSAKGYDADKDHLKFTWDFGDGHKSYKKETRHKFKKAGKYKITLKVSDGSEDKIETFNITVEKFPKSKVKIVSVSPNPTGKDSESEYITLQNKSKKKINLKDWSVATGSKNLYNHPITGDLVVKPGKTITLTRNFSKFALNNKKATVELRYPNGKVASQLAYDKKKESVAEDEVYTKESGAWAWVAPKTETKLAIADSVPSPTPLPIEKEKEEIKIAEEDATPVEIIPLSEGIVAGASIEEKREPPQPQKISYMVRLFNALNLTINYFLYNITALFN